MGDQNEGKQNPGYTDQQKKRENERAGQTPQEKQEKDRASNPSEQRPNQNQQFDPSHIQKK